MDELPEEILKAVKKKWSELQEESTRSQTKKTKTCENCNCYRCCTHLWVCGECGLKRKHFTNGLTLTNKRKREKIEEMVNEEVEDIVEENIIEEDTDLPDLLRQI